MMLPPPRVIEVRWDFVGYHRWPEAAEVAGPQRDYLASRHRHRFECSARVAVDHNDREIEFHDLLDHLHDLFEHGEDLGRFSCEDIADVIADRIDDRWPNRWRQVSVFEDGEAGATITVDPTERLN